MSIADQQFTDLIIGGDFAEFTRVPGAATNPCPVPRELNGEVQDIRNLCLNFYQKFKEEEFPVKANGVLYRATLTPGIWDEPIFCLRRVDVVSRNLKDLGFKDYVISHILNKQHPGLVLVVGAMANGKTSTAQSISAARMGTLGGVGVAIEDPPETSLNGPVQGGRWIQIWARPRIGGYRGVLKRTLRTGADMFLLGEIRDEEVAREAVLASCNGHFLVSTMHAAGLVEAIQRLDGLCRTKDNQSTWAMLAQGLSMVIWQELVRIKQPDGSDVVRLRHKTLLVRNESEVQAKIRSGSIAELLQDATAQEARKVWRDN